jgi:hypothetical protein
MKLDHSTRRKIKSNITPLFLSSMVCVINQLGKHIAALIYYAAAMGYCIPAVLRLIRAPTITNLYFIFICSPTKIKSKFD